MHSTIRRLESSVTKWFSLRDKRVKNGLDFDLSSDNTNLREDKKQSVVFIERVFNVARQHFCMKINVVCGKSAPKT